MLKGNNEHSKETHEDLENFKEHPFKIIAPQLETLMDKYKTRSFDEDIEYLTYSLHGMNSLEKVLNTDFEKGLMENDFKEREKYFGNNKEEGFKTKSFFSFWMKAFEDLTLKILLVASFVSIAVNIIVEGNSFLSWVDGLAIFLAVLIVSVVSAFCDYKKQMQFVKLNDYAQSNREVDVRRNGIECFVNPEVLQVGDIIKIVAGMLLPADGIVISGNGIKADESALTGESEEVSKVPLSNCVQKRAEAIEEEGKDVSRLSHNTLPSPILISGTKITLGEGYYLAILVGKKSSVGQIRAKIETKEETTPLQDKLEILASDIGKLGTICASITVFVMFLRFFLEKPLNGQSFDWSVNIGSYVKIWFHYLLTGICIIACAIPEGLPLAVMISLAYSVRKMLLDMNFVKKLASCETMGGVNNICSDKTGTLTKNEMTVTNVWYGHNDIELKEDEQSFQFDQYFSSEEIVNLLVQGISCNTNASMERGNSTEKALLKMLNKFGVDLQIFKKDHLPENFVRFQFDSDRKIMSTVVENVPNTERLYGKRLHLKGAAEVVLRKCTHYINSEGERQVMEKKTSQEIEKVILDYGDQALRNICLAYKDLKPNEGGAEHSDMEGKFGVVERGGFTFLGIFGIRDVIRKEVAEAVRKCNSAGIRIRMVTGDYMNTAVSIAKKCGIIKNEQESIALEGKDFYKLLGGLYCSICDYNIEDCQCLPDERVEKVRNLEEFIKIEPRLDVISRSRPEDKYLLVTALREMNNIVAVTGDGTNDAPALRKANVGFAMGVQGTEISREAADIIILDDNFASIVKSVMWGRSIYDNVKRFLQFQLTVSILALITSFIGACILKESPLSAIQLLWVNLIMDSLASLALATEPPQENLLDRKPYGKDEHIVSKVFITL